MRGVIAICQDCTQHVPEANQIVSTTFEELIFAIPCPTCGALVKKFVYHKCKLPNGRPRRSREVLTGNLYELIRNKVSQAAE